MARLNLDLIAVGTRIEHLAGRLSPYRERIVDELPRFPVDWLDDLASLARAVIWTSLEVSAASPMHNNRAPVLAEARVLRRRLWAALATRAAFAEPDEARTPARLVRRTSAHVAVTLQSLARSLRASGLEGTPVVVGDLDRAEAVAAQLIRMSGVLDRASAERTAAVELRAKAVVLLSSRYEEIRAAVLYVGRREKGIERVVPPLGNVRIVPRKVGRRWEAVVVGAGEAAGAASERGGAGPEDGRVAKGALF